MNFDFEVIRSKRKTICIEIKKDASVIIRAPLGMSEKEINRFIEEKQLWILKHLKQLEEKKTSEITKMSDAEIKSLTALAKIEVPKRVDNFAKVMGLSYGKITIKKQTSRWGSCSSKKNLNFNFLLMLCPIEVRDYIIIHELSHLIHMNHSRDFWKCVERYCPEYKKYKKWLRDNGDNLIERIK